MKCYLPEITPARLGSAVFLLWLFSLMGPSPIPAAQAPGSSAGANQGNAQPVETIVGVASTKRETGKGRRAALTGRLRPPVSRLGNNRDRALYSDERF